MNLSGPASNKNSVAIIGGGPAGLMAAEVIAQAGFKVSVYDAMPSVGRKFLLAGVGGMNITHAEDTEKFLTRYTEAAPVFAALFKQFDNQALREWVHGLGIQTFVGSSGRVFPSDMKAAPLLRAWLHRLREMNVKFFPRHRWVGWTEDGDLEFYASERDANETTRKLVSVDACVLAMGGASWARLGSDGAWVPLLRNRGVAVAELQPSNCGFDIDWSEHIRAGFAGEPLSTVTLFTRDQHGVIHRQRGECTITEKGIEGGAVYSLSPILREMINHSGAVKLWVDLLPDQTEEAILKILHKPRGKESQSNFFRKNLKLSPVKINLLRDSVPSGAWQDYLAMAQLIKSLPLNLLAPRPINEAISSAGGVMFSALDAQFMLVNMPGIFCAGEMLDWEAPTGGYLLTACFATGRAAGLGAVKWLQDR